MLATPWSPGGQFSFIFHGPWSQLQEEPLRVPNPQGPRPRTQPASGPHSALRRMPRHGQGRADPARSDRQADEGFHLRPGGHPIHRILRLRTTAAARIWLPTISNALKTMAAEAI